MESHIVSQDKASQSMAEVQPPAEEEAKHEIPNKISMQGVARLGKACCLVLVGTHPIILVLCFCLS